jgi:hypothetical protein
VDLSVTGAQADCDEKVEQQHAVLIRGKIKITIEGSGQECPLYPNLFWRQFFCG